MTGAPANPLDALGLDAAMLGERSHVEPAEDPTGWGGVTGPVLAGLLPILASLQFSPVTVPAVERAGFAVEMARHQNRRVIALTETSEGALAVQGTGDTAGRFEVSGTTAYLTPDADESYVVLNAAGQGLLIENSGLTYTHITVPRIETLAPLSCQATSWLTTHDPAWLHELVASQTETGDPLLAAAAAGACMRLTEFGDTEALSHLLRGEVHEPSIQPQLWFESLPGDTRRLVESLAVAQVELLAGRIDGLARQLQLTDEGWCETWRGVLLGRDDLESVRVLLHASGCGTHLAQDLRAFDTMADRFAASLPRQVRFVDERLFCVALRDPSAWWARDCDAPDIA
jgi:hypothetical protein